MTTYVNSTVGAINGSTTCTAPLVRNFTVATAFTVADVDLGVYATHTWRGDIRITLQAPDGTRVQLVDGDANTVSGDHFNVRLDDAGTQLVNTDAATGNHSTTTPPPFQHRFIPNSALSAFNGRAAAGTWRMEICDIFPGADDGEFRYAALYLTSAPTAFADLSLTKSVNTASPISGANVTYTLVATSSSASNRTATGIQVTDLLPAGVSYVSHSGPGTYTPGTGIWQVG
ncbi:MAG TPA: proprotein convertase P-domain-containing protein, partial [Novosphingobium sp.]|nr:proprotein convertase P-domain-containing protein [Novosphingobium sp.]